METGMLDGWQACQSSMIKKQQDPGDGWQARLEYMHTAAFTCFWGLTFQLQMACVTCLDR